MKPIVKHTLSIAAFILGLAILLLVASQIFVPKNNDSIHDASAGGILAEPKDSIDVLFLGDSESYCAISPLMIWDESGITSYVCGTSAQKLFYTEEFLYTAFESQSPKLVVLETNAIFRDYPYSSMITNKADRLFPVFRYHDRWKKLSLKDFRLNAKYTCVENNKGYKFYDIVKPADYESYNNMSPSDETVKVPSKNKGYLDSIITYCKENGAEFLFLSTPSIVNWNSKRHNTVQELADKYDVGYLDLNLCEEITINWKTDTRDKGDHLNYWGAVKVSNYLGKYLTETGRFEDRRDDANYDAWNSAYDTFVETVNCKLEESKQKCKED